MKTSIRCKLLIFIAAFSTASYAAVTQVSAPKNLYDVANIMNDGDIIELTSSGGVYYWSALLNISTDKAITIRAKSGLPVRPKVIFSGNSGGFLRHNASLSIPSTKNWTFDGIEFDGYNADASYYASNFILSNLTSPNYGINIKINNCILRNFSSRTIYYQGSGTNTNPVTAHGGDIEVTNTEFRDIGTGVLYSNNVVLYSPNNVKFTNCLFLGPSSNGSSAVFLYLNAASYNSYSIDHCTFVDSDQREIQLRNPATTSYIRNSLFVNSINDNTVNIYNATLASNCGIYYTAAGNKNLLYPLSTAARTSNPLLDENTGIAQATTYLTGTTDGLPTGFYGNQISISENTISDLSYSLGNGPSSAKSFVVSATRLTNNLAITPSANFELSTSLSTGYSSSSLTQNQLGGNIANTTIYVRLKAGLTENLYSGTINVSSNGAATKQIALSGTIVSKPTLFTSTNSITGFNYSLGSGPSTQSMFTLNGAGLTGSVTILAPTGFEISLNSGTSFSGSNSMTVSQIAGKITNLNIFVRLKAGLLQNNYTGNITFTSTGADTKQIALSGIVNPAPAILNVSKSSLTNFSYIFGNGPSGIQSFSINGTGLTNNIIITAPESYELSTFTGTSFRGLSAITLTPSNGSLSPTNIYARLKTNLAEGTYENSIVITSTGATTKQINLLGYVSEATSVSISATKISGFEYILNNGPSAEKSFDMTGTNLGGYVLVSAPKNYEVSTSNGVDFSGSGQILIDQAAVNGQTLRLYVRLVAGLSAGAYSGNVSVSSSNATTKTIALTGNVYNQLVVATDPAFYEPRFSGNFSFSNKWILSKNTNNYTTGNELIAASGTARDMAVRNGKMLFIDRGNKQIVTVNGETGIKEMPVILNPNLFIYTGRNVANTADSIYTAGTLTFNNIKVDASGNVLVGNLITTNTQRFQIYKIDMATGNGTLLIDQANLANLFPLATTLRFDYFGVWGDINSNAVIYAPNASAAAMEVYKWVITNGIAGTPSVIRLDNTSIGTYFTGIESLGGNPHIFPIAADKFYIDGGGTYPTLLNATGSILDGFHRQPSALIDSITLAGQSLSMNPGNNGVFEFNIGDKYFMVTSATNTTISPASSFRLFKFKDATKSFADIDCLWTFPQAGMGTASNAYRTALPIVVTNGNSAKIYIYCGENGFGMYEMIVNTISTDTENKDADKFQLRYRNGKLYVNQPVKRLEVYTLSGQLINAISNNSILQVPTTQGVYITKILTTEGRIMTKKVIFD